MNRKIILLVGATIGLIGLVTVGMHLGPWPTFGIFLMLWGNNICESQK